MIYTCYEMIRDCRDGKPEGWSHFIEHYVPVVRRVLQHYCPQDGPQAATDRVLADLRADLLTDLEPGPERQFVAALRQKIVGQVTDAAEIALELRSLREALQPLTVVEKEAVWLETMRYSSEDAARMLRVDPATVEKARERAAELIRGKIERWRRTLPAENGLALGREAAQQAAAECVGEKGLLEMIDGRATWARRQQMERHITECWHCVDHFCRLHEVCDLLRVCRPLAESEAAEYRALLGVELKKQPFWRKLRGHA